MHTEKQHATNAPRRQATNSLVASAHKIGRRLAVARTMTSAFFIINGVYMSHSGSPNPPAAGSNDEAGHIPVRELAAQIYIQLIKEAVVINVTDAGSTAALTASPDSLAKMSFKLAEAFLNAGDEIKAGTQPKFAKFDVDKLDFDSWTTK